MTRLLVSVIATLAIVSIAHATTAGQSSYLFSEKMFKEGDIEGAIESAKAATVADPTSADYQLRLAFYELQSGNCDGAITAADRALELDPKRAAAWYTLGLSQKCANDMDRAYSSFIKAARMDRENAAAWYESGIIKAKNKKFEDAVLLLEVALAVNPKHRDAWFNLAKVYFKQQKREDAFVALRHATSIDPEFRPAWRLYGVVAGFLGNTEEAFKGYTETLRLEPNDPSILALLSGVLVDKEDYKSALTNAFMAIELNPNIVDSWVNKGRAYAALKEFDKARAAFRHVVKIYPENHKVWYHVGNFHEGMNENEEAIKAYSQALVLSAQNPQPHYYYRMAIASANSGNCQGFGKARGKLISLVPRDSLYLKDLEPLAEKCQ